MAAVALLLLIFAGLGTAAVTSVDEISFNSNSEFFNGDVFVIDFSSSQSTDSIDVFLSKDQLSQAANGEAQQSLTIHMSTQETYARYSFQNGAHRDLVNLDLVTHISDTEATAADWATTHCYDVDDDGSHEYYQTAVWTWTGEIDIKVWCARQNGQWGSVADISGGDEIFTSQWCVKASEKQEQCATLSNGDSGDGRRTRLGEHVIIDWTGNLDTGEDPEPADDELGLHSNTIDGNWRIISEREYNEWQNYISGLPNKYQQWANGEVSESILQSNIDSRGESAAATYTQSPFTGGTVLDSSLKSGQWKLDMADQLAYPSFAVYVDGAEYVEVSKPVGTPRIISTSGATFGELESGTVSMTVENAGSAEGSFSGRVTSCSDGFSFDDTQKTKTVGAGSQTSYSFAVSFTSDSSSQQEVSGTCTFEVVNQLGERVTSSVAVTGIQESECTPGEQFVKVVNGKETIFVCDEDGLSSSKVDVCEADEDAVFKSDQYECVKQSHPTDDDDGLLSWLSGFLSNPLESLTDGVSEFLAGLALVFHLLAAALAGGVTVRVFQSFAGVVEMADPRMEVAAVYGGAVLVFGVVFFLQSVFVSGLIVVAAVGIVVGKGLMPDIPGVGG